MPELTESVLAYVNELDSPPNAWGQSIHTVSLATLREQFGKSETDVAIDAECDKRAKRRQCENNGIPIYDVVKWKRWKRGNV